MESKYTELEKWKQLKDNGDITEEEYNAEKQRILNSKEVNANSKPKRKGIKVITLLIIIIVIIGVIAAIVITANLNDKIQYERIEITTNEGITLPVNKTNLDKGIAEIEKQLSVADTIGIVYSGNNIQYYLIPTFNSSQDEAKSALDYYMGSESIRKYSIKTINDDDGKVTDGSPFYIKSAITFMPMPLYDIKQTLYIAGGYLYDNWELLVINYENGNIKILNDQTNIIKNSREENKNISIFEKAMKYVFLSNKYESGITEKQLKELYENTTGVDKNNVWIGTINNLYNSWEECLADVKKSNLLNANTLKGRIYKGSNSQGKATLNFIDDSRVEIDYTNSNNSETIKKICDYEIYGDAIEIQEDDDGKYTYYIEETGSIEYKYIFLDEVK